MKGFATTYTGLFESVDERPAINSIRIPIIQRDYAQGRQDEDTALIRQDFLDVLIGGLTTPQSVGLDFIYGDVSDGVLTPLDGQQRLTTLFLLHWYVASRAGRLDPEAPWTRFRYATRLSAEYFCRELVTNTWPAQEHPVAWITDQAWYLFPWRVDPTITSMLVMIGAIHERLNDEERDFGALWERLTSQEQAAISFLFLPIEDIDSGDDLYIKMNSRGKSLTDFEVFKARLEKILTGAARQEELSWKIDREWSDLLWHYEGGDFLIDHEFENYFNFIIDVCQWRTGSPRSSEPLHERARSVFVEHEDAPVHLDFLFFAFDTWVGEDPTDDVPEHVLTSLFRVEGGDGPGLLLFESQSPNLFRACLEKYGTPQFSLAETLFLFAVIIFRQLCPDGSDERLKQRLRSLRNIAETAPDEVRNEYMHELIAATITLMTGSPATYLDGLKRFNQARLDDEKLKHQLIEEHPEVRPAVHAIEDHELLRGRLFAFTLDATLLGPRGDTFRDVTTSQHLPRLASALLTKGDYSRRLGHRRQFGVAGRRRGGGSWRDVFTSGSRELRSATRSALEQLLDDVVSRGGATEQALDDIVRDWLVEQESAGRYGWDYYFVRYPTMLSAPKGVYVSAYDPEGAGYGYRIDMLLGGDYRSPFTDPYLLAIWHQCGQPQRLQRPRFRSWDHTGTDKAMKLAGSGTGLRSTGSGFEILMPEEREQTERVRAVLRPYGLGPTNLLTVAPTDRDSHPLDTEDRVQVGVQVVQSLLEAGL